MNKDQFIIFVSKYVLIGILAIPALVLMVWLFEIYPISFFWLIGYGITMWFIISLKSSYLTKGAFVIYLGAAIAVLGKSYLIELPETAFNGQKNLLVLDTLFQVMLMASSGLGGGLLTLHITSKDKHNK